MHYQQSPSAEMKFVRCLKGRVWDVAVDLRTGSRTFLKWHAEELSPHNARMLAIPEGLAHGFQVLDPESELLYLHTAPYAPAVESGVSYNDQTLAITWPMPISNVSARDRHLPLISPDFQGL
jgi:dTDP-4-dehydrorhamnose 3,5-epimerase